MKQNCQNKKFAVWFDLHDTLVNSKTTWLKAFKQVCPNKNIYKKVKKEYLSGIRKITICEKYGIDYLKAKAIHNANLKPLKNVVKLYDYLLSKNFNIYLVTNANKERTNEDLQVVNSCKFQKYYTRDLGIKPNQNYINSILQDNNLTSAIMIGDSKKKDVFNLPQVKTLIISKFYPFFVLKLLFNRKLKSIKNT